MYKFEAVIAGTTYASQVYSFTTQSMQFTWSELTGTYADKLYVTETDACVGMNVSWNSSIAPQYLTVDCGIDLYDFNYNLIGSKTDSSSGTLSYNVNMWYNINAELGVYLTRGTIYHYRLRFTYNGNTIYSDWRSFTTLGNYTVTFDPNGGSCNTSYITITRGSKYIVPDASRAGHTFQGWFTSVGTQITNSTVFSETSNQVLYAHWKANTYSVAFCDWDGNILDVQTVEYGKSATAPANPTREGYTFTGWDKAFTNITGDITITAQYKINTYTVTFKDGVTGGTISTATVEHGADAVLPTPPTHDGYTFTGWDKDGKNITADTTITALYEKVNVPTPTPTTEPTPVPSDAPQFAVSSAKGRAGETVTVTVSVKNNPGFTTADLYFTYDSSVLELAAAPKAGSVAAGCQIITSPVLSAIPYHAVIVNGLADVTDDGELLTFTFLIKDNAPEGLYNIDFTVGEDDTCNVDGDKIAFATVSGSITVFDYTLGDANGDGKINTRDAVMILQYFAGWDIQIDMKAADVDGNGKVNTRDAVLILQYFAGWTNTPLS